MKAIRKIILGVVFVAVNVLSVNAQDKKDHAAAVAGHYEGDANIELLQQELKMKLELKRTHADSVIVIITDFLLPTGQKFSFRSKGLSVKPVTENGKTVYKLFTTFVYSYNNMPFKITANATIREKDLDSEVKANLMEAMETKVTYKAKRIK